MQGRQGLEVVTEPVLRAPCLYEGVKKCPSLRLTLKFLLNPYSERRQVQVTSSYCDLPVAVLLLRV